MDNLPGVQKAILDPRTVALRNVNQASRILHTSPRALIEHRSASGRRYEISPSVQVPVTYRSGEVHHLDLAVAIQLPGQWPWQKWKSQAYLIADRNLDGPVAAINKEPRFEFDIPQSGTDIDDEEIDLVLNKIENGIADLVEERRRKARRRFGLVSKSAAVVAVIGIIAGGATWGFHHNAQNVAAQQAAEQATTEAANKAHWDAIAHFDGKGIVLQSEVVSPGNAGIAALDRSALSLVDEVPKFDDLLDNPRKLRVLAGSSQAIGIVSPGKGVRAVTNAPKGHVIVDILEDGTVWISALPDNTVSDNTLSPPSYVVLIQSDKIKE